MDFFTFSAQAGPARTAHRSFYIQITYERENGISLGWFSILRSYRVTWGHIAYHVGYANLVT